MRVDGTVSTVSFPNAYDPEADPQQLTWPSVRIPAIVTGHSGRT